MRQRRSSSGCSQRPCVMGNRRCVERSETVVPGETVSRRAFGPDSDTSWLLGRQLDVRRPLSVRNPPEDGTDVRISPEFGSCETRQLCRVKLSHVRHETVVPGETVSGGDGCKLWPARWAYHVRSNGQSTGHSRLEPLNQLTKQQVSVYRYARMSVFKQFG